MGPSWVGKNNPSLNYKTCGFCILGREAISLSLFYHKCIWDFLCCCQSFYPSLNSFSTFLLSYVAVRSNRASRMSHGYIRPSEGGGGVGGGDCKTSLYTCTLVKHHVTNYMSQHKNKEFQFRKNLSIKHWSNLLVPPPGHFFSEKLYSCIKASLP